MISGDKLTSVTGVGFTGADARTFRIDPEKSVTVSVPDGAATGPVILRAGQEYVTSDMNFTVT